MLDILVVEHLTKRIVFFIERFGYHHLDLIETSEGGISYLEKNLYDYIFLGGELGKEAGSGCDIARYLDDNKSNPNTAATIIIHSWNLMVVDKMISLLPQADYLPFSEKQLSTLAI
jgi:hypothetical protein